MCHKISIICYKLQTNPSILLFINSSVSKKEVLPEKAPCVIALFISNSDMQYDTSLHKKACSPREILMDAACFEMFCLP